jgi:PBS lyase HEAT-like repeat
MKSGVVADRDIVVLANAGVVQAIPVLEEEFRRETDVTTKAQIASGLVQLKDHDDAYWNFLLMQATLAVDSDVPDPFFDSQGEVAAKGKFSPELEAWAQAHHVDANAAAKIAMYDLPGKVLFLGTSGDPRGGPLLRRALWSHNSQILIAAAEGLANIQDKGSIPLIIAACQRVERLAPVLARSLIYFDDPEAQKAVDTYLSKEDAKIFRDVKASGHKIFGD